MQKIVQLREIMFENSSANEYGVQIGENHKNGSQTSPDSVPLREELMRTRLLGNQTLAGGLELYRCTVIVYSTTVYFLVKEGRKEGRPLTVYEVCRSL